MESIRYNVIKLLGLACLLAGVGPCLAAVEDNWELREHANGELYWVYVPTGYAADGAYPVVLRLHGCCWDGVVPVEPPQDPVATAWHGFNDNRQPEPTFIVSPMSTGGWISKGDKVIQILDDVMAEFPIDPQRQILSGFSMGAAGSVDFLLAYRDRFAAATIIAGGFNNAASIDVAALAHTPVWLAIGTLDGGYTNNRTLVERWRTANGFGAGSATEPLGQYPRFSVFSRVGHGPAMEGLLGDPAVVEWALQQRRNGNQPPWVRFDTPGYEAILNPAGEAVTVSGSAGDPDGLVARIELWANGELVLDTGGPDFSYAWPPERQTPGPHRFRVRVTDNGAAAAQVNEDILRVYVATPMRFPVATLPPAAAGHFYTLDLPFEGGADPAIWKVARGASVPPGLTLNENGRLFGIPSATGQFAFKVQALDRTLLRNEQVFQLEVRAAPSTAPAAAQLSLNISQGRWGAWAVGEPLALSGYGEPAGAFDYSPHPVFDVVLDTAGIENAQLLRLGGVDPNSTAAELIRFHVHGRARVYVGYNSGPAGTVPAWLAERGFSDTGLAAPAYLGSFRFYVREYADEAVSLGGNERSLHGGRKHYIVLVQPAGPVRPVNLPGQVAISDYIIAGWNASWMGYHITQTSWLPWFYHGQHGWIYAAGDGPGEQGGWYYALDGGALWWTHPDSFPYVYAIPGGWILRG
jgi:hypothetical protein